MFEELEKVIEEFPDYTASIDGRIWSKKSKKYMKTFISHSGYRIATLYKTGIGMKKVSLHRLLAKVFIPNPENKIWINHKDGNKLNNSLENLEWCTPSENNKHAYDSGLNIAKKGEAHYSSKLTNRQREEILKLYGVESQKQISKQYGVSTTTIHELFKSKNNKLHYLCRFTEEQIISMRDLKGIFSQSEIARRFNVNRSFISQLFSGKTYKNIKEANVCFSR